MGVTHHSNEQVEHEEGGNDGKGKVYHAVHEGQIYIVVRGPIDDSKEQLKSGEQGHGIVIELTQAVRVLSLEDDVKG